MRSALLFIALMLSLPNAGADPQPLAGFNDPSGDDFGAGNLAYPNRDDYQAGDLDLLQLKIDRDASGYWFEAKFRNAIRNPGNVQNTVGNDSLADFARKGFYQFNLDIYVDTDRINGSGNVFTLPGRKVQIDPAYAWEKVMVLTPRPELMRQQLLDALHEQFPARADAEIAAVVDQSIFFPSRIKVRGKSVSFLVPASFFAGSDGSDWAVTALVTGAITAIPADFSFLPATKSVLERLQLGVMQPVPGHPIGTFGYGGAGASPVVDLLGEDAQQQAQLEAMTGLTGVAWGAHAQGAAASDPSAVPVMTIDRLFLPRDQAAKPAASTPADASPAADKPSIVQRMQTLQKLFDQKLIDEDEYKQQKQRILQEL
ncbi:MAG: hypothetical protein HZB47_14275 [Nitrosomonadales bacterium]|nr:hypothetical protein [Nitrosomonadales bacterium]